MSLRRALVCCVVVLCCLCLCVACHGLYCSADCSQALRARQPFSPSTAAAAHARKGTRTSSSSSISAPTPTLAPAAAGSTACSTSQQQQSHALARPIPICSFCCGSVQENQRTREPECLIYCAQCGLSGHPSCLRWEKPAEVTEHIRSLRLRWLCLDCKRCTICADAHGPKGPEVSSPRTLSERCAVAHKRSCFGVSL